MAGIALMSSGLTKTMITNHAITVQMEQKGTDTNSQCPNDTWTPDYPYYTRSAPDYHVNNTTVIRGLTCSKYDTANTFCKLEMGVIIPPKLHAYARPNNNALENLMLTANNVSTNFNNQSDCRTLTWNRWEDLAQSVK